MPLLWPILQAKAFQILAKLTFQDGLRVAKLNLKDKPSTIGHNKVDTTSLAVGCPPDLALLFICSGNPLHRSWSQHRIDTVWN